MRSVESEEVVSTLGAEGAGKAMEEEKEEEEEQDPDEVKDPVGGPRVTGEFHVEDGLEPPQDGRQHHRNDPAQRKADDQRENGSDENAFHRMIAK
jgi:hypothetical protein